MTIRISTRFVIDIGGERELDISTQELEVLTRDLKTLYANSCIDQMRKKKTASCELNISVTVKLGEQHYTFDYDELKPLYRQLTNAPKKREHKEYTYSPETTDKIYQIIRESSEPLDVIGLMNISELSSGSIYNIVGHLHDRGLIIKVKGTGKNRWKAKDLHEPKEERIILETHSINPDQFNILKQDREKRMKQMREK
jgi:hypothetical protein